MLLGTGKTRLHTLLDHAPLELSKDTHYSEQRLTGWRGGVDALLMPVQINACGMQFLKQTNEVDERPPKAIH